MALPRRAYGESTGDSTRNVRVSDVRHETTIEYPATGEGQNRGVLRCGIDQLEPGEEQQQDDRRPGPERFRSGNQVVARRVARDGERSLSCPGDGRRAARRVPKGWRARCRGTRRGRRMRRQGNTRQRAIPHHGAGSGYPDGYRVAHWNSPPPLPAAVAGRGPSIAKRTVRKALRRTFAPVRFCKLLTTFPLTRADADPSVGARTHMFLRRENEDDAPTALRPAAPAGGRSAGASFRAWVECRVTPSATPTYGD